MNWKKYYKRCSDPVECVRSFMIAFNDDLLKTKGSSIILFYREQAREMATMERDFLYGRRLNENWFEHCVSDMMLAVAREQQNEDTTYKNLTKLFGELPVVDENLNCVYLYSCINGSVKIVLDVVFVFKHCQEFMSSKGVVWSVVHVHDKIVLWNGQRNLTMSRGRVLDMQHVPRETL